MGYGWGRVRYGWGTGGVRGLAEHPLGARAEDAVNSPCEDSEKHAEPGGIYIYIGGIYRTNEVRHMGKRGHVREFFSTLPKRVAHLSRESEWHSIGTHPPRGTPPTPGRRYPHRRRQRASKENLVIGGGREVCV